jgi:hypothetical protein
VNVVIQGCLCKQEFQDKTYGQGKRVMNPLPGKKEGQVRCTSCGTEQPIRK